MFAHTHLSIGGPERDPVLVGVLLIRSAIDLETGTAGPDYIGLYGGGSKLLLECFQYIQQAANRIVAAIAPENSASPA